MKYYQCFLLTLLISSSVIAAPKKKVYSAHLKIVYVVANKNWEVEPILDAMTNNAMRPTKLPFPTVLHSPQDGSYKSDSMRAVFELATNDTINLKIFVWCVQDLMTSASSSNSQNKDSVLKKIFMNRPEKPDLVIAMGTAGAISNGFSMAGSVVLGSQFFLRDGDPSNKVSHFENKQFGELIKSNVNLGFFSIFNSDFQNAVESKFVPVPNHPASKASFIESPSYVDISTVNVTDYTKYGWVDQESIDQYYAKTKRDPLKADDSIHRAPIGSFETTHGIIKLNTTAPIIFISAITDNLGNFDSEVRPNQNYIAAFNSGMVLGQLLVNLNDYVYGQRNNTFSFALNLSK